MIADPTTIAAIEPNGLIVDSSTYNVSTMFIPNVNGNPNSLSIFCGPFNSSYTKDVELLNVFASFFEFQHALANSHTFGLAYSRIVH